MTDLSKHIAKFASNDLVCEQVIGRLQLVANKARFRILCLLREGWFSVNEIVQIIQAGQLSNVSQQLKILTLAGLVEKKKESRNVFYTLRDEGIREMINFLEHQFTEEQQ